MKAFQTKSDVVQIDPVSGALQMTKNLHMSEPSHTFTVIAKDRGQPSLTGFTTVRIEVVPTNEFSPIFNKSDYLRSVARSTTVGTRIQKVEATDNDLPGPNSDIIYSFAEANTSSFFKIDPTSGNYSDSERL